MLIGTTLFKQDFFLKKNPFKNNADLISYFLLLKLEIIQAGSGDLSFLT